MRNEEFKFEVTSTNVIRWNNSKTIRRYIEIKEEVYSKSKGASMAQHLLNCIEATKVIAEECDPQEVYCYEFNNHECGYGYNGDSQALAAVIDIWGEEVARDIKRVDGLYSIEHIIADNFINL